MLDGQLTPEERQALEGGIALVGYAAVGKGEVYPSALRPRLPGVFLVADILDNLLSERFLSKPTAGFSAAVVLIMALVAAWAVRLNPLSGALLVTGACIAWGVVCYAALSASRAVPFVAPSTALLGSFAVLFLRKTRYEALSRRRIQSTFGQFVAPEIVARLAQSQAQVELGGETRMMSVFFLDIAHFTSISERLAPKELVAFLNRYLSDLSARIHGRHGVIDKYIGDCVMAFWNAPLPQPDHAALACLAALDCQEAVATINRELDPRFPIQPQIRIGIASGDMTVGLTGSSFKLQYTVIGDCVNLASRLEGANKLFGSRVLVNEFCFNAARHTVEGRALGRLRVIGKKEPVMVYEVLAPKGLLPYPWPEALGFFEQGRAAMEAGRFSEARECLAATTKLLPDDPPSRFLLDQVAQRLQSPSPWDGIFVQPAK